MGAKLESIKGCSRRPSMHFFSFLDVRMRDGRKRLKQDRGAEQVQPGTQCSHSSQAADSN